MKMSQYTEDNVLLQEQFHRHRYEAHDNILYYFFSARGGWAGTPWYTDIWREKCPCPHGPRCRFGAVCCFDSREPCDFAFQPNRARELEARRLFSSMRLLFCRRAPVAPPEEAEEEEDDVCAEVWRATCPAPDPDPEPAPNYELHPYNFIASLGLPLALSNCNHPKGKRCRKEGAAHSLDEMLRPFVDERVQRYYMYWLRYVEHQNKRVAHKPLLPLRVRSDADGSVRCRHCGDRDNLLMRLCAAHPSSTLMPACAAYCNGCKHKTMISVYHM
jgi:hypothetical protein